MEKNTVLIKVTSSIGSAMLHNAESHTLYYFCKWLVKDNIVVISGIEKESLLKKKLEDLGVEVKKPFLSYLYLKRLKKLMHIPFSIINTLIDTLKVKPDLLFCIGGVFYNGLAIVISSKLLNIPTLVRSAEDHIALANFERPYFFKHLYARFRAYLSKITIKNSDYFLTVGKSSKNYFINTYKLSKESTFFIPGPIDHEKIEVKEIIESKKYDSFFIDKENLVNFKTILFIGSEDYKGVREVFELCSIIYENKLNIKIIWISNSENICKRISLLGYDNFVRNIRPLDKSKLRNILRKVDFLFWSTQLGVGYGQIILESILCKTEIICYRPIGDVKHFVGENYYSNMNQVIKRLNGETQMKKIEIPNYMDQQYLENKHRQLINKILKK